MNTIILNGETRSLDHHTVAALLEGLGHQGKRVAVEKNGEIVPKSLHPSTPIVHGDRLEIVVAVGGG